MDTTPKPRYRQRPDSMQKLIVLVPAGDYASFAELARSNDRTISAEVRRLIREALHAAAGGEKDGAK